MRRILYILPYAVLALFLVGWAAERLSSDDAFAFPTPEPGADKLAVLPPSDSGPSARIAGTCIGPEGEPLVEALVHLDQEGAPRWTRTDAAGAFEVTGFGGPPWRVTVGLPGYMPQVFEVASSPAELRIEQPFRPPPSFPDIDRRNLVGRVLAVLPDAQLTGYEVWLLPVQPPHELSGVVPRRAALDADGAFTIEGLAVGDYRVSVTPPWARGTSWPNLCDPRARAYAHRLRSPGTLELPLHAGEIRGTVTDTEGEFLEGAVVWVEDAEDARRLWPPTSSDTSGRFLVADLPPGAYSLVVRAGEAEQKARVQVIAGATRAIELELEPARR